MGAYCLLMAVFRQQAEYSRLWDCHLFAFICLSSRAYFLGNDYDIHKNSAIVRMICLFLWHNWGQTSSKSFSNEKKKKKKRHLSDASHFMLDELNALSQFHNQTFRWVSAIISLVRLTTTNIMMYSTVRKVARNISPTDMSAVDLNRTFNQRKMLIGYHKKCQPSRIAFVYMLRKLHYATYSQQ